MVTLQQLLKAVIDQNATDLHLVADSPPTLRVNGSLVRVKVPALTPEETKEICYSILTDEQKSLFEETKELDFSFGVKKLARFRANIFFQRGYVSGVFRRIPFNIPNLDDLGLPPIINEFTQKVNGMILVTGPTGSGKSTTIASMVDRINQDSFGHIITIEDPIEYTYQHKNCIVNQREVGPDTWAFKSALKYLLRQDPDYCVIGEMRDIETIEAALTVAETGHLVFGTLHTNSAIQTINRIVNVFSGDQQERIRVVLSFVIQGIVCQQLLPAINGGLVLACEVLVPTPGIRNLIRENKIHQIMGMMQSGQSKSGMITMNQTLVGLVLRRKIDMKTAFEASTEPEELDGMLKKAGI